MICQKKHVNLVLMKLTMKKDHSQNQDIKI